MHLARQNRRALQGLRRIRSLWTGNRAPRIHTLQGFCRSLASLCPWVRAPALNLSAACRPIHSRLCPS